MKCEFSANLLGEFNALASMMAGTLGGASRAARIDRGNFVASP